jgi:hypothetical protein
MTWLTHLGTGRRRVALAAVVAMLCAACGGSSGGSSTGPNGSGQAVSLTVDGVAMTLAAPASATQSNAPYFTSISASGAQGSIILELGAYPPVAATHTCGTDGVDVIYSATGGPAYYAGVNSTSFTNPYPTSCTITVTSFTAAGKPFQGTFSGTVVLANDGGSKHVITNGQFTLTAP